MSLPKIALICLLIPILNACSQPVVTVKEPSRMYPPLALTLDTRLPDFTGETYGDVIQYAIDLRASLLSCNVDKASLRDWRNGQ